MKRPAVARRQCVWVVVLLLLDTWTVQHSRADNATDDANSRQKRLLWITTDGRLALPPGTELTITPSLSLPFVRHPPDGFLSNMAISMPFTIIFDKLGLTDNVNPFGGFTSILSRSKTQPTASILADYVSQLIQGRRLSRSTSTSQKSMHKYFHGGERALLYKVVEDLLASFGMDGKACLLRVICEVHGHNGMHKFGIIGEFLHLFLTVSKSSYAHLMEDYVTAETIGKRNRECYPYYKECPKSLFASNYNYSENDDSASSTENEDALVTVDNNDGTDAEKKASAENIMMNPTPMPEVM